ncbi:MAG TPA: HD domain-containing phosphohydrolase [Acidobacteriota bacterium]|jgi:putative nucleotidyltransferase with HDIG domain|nr:HD domain-containing phosphohydrolase [Acidobacteriota bacterium]
MKSGRNKIIYSLFLVLLLMGTGPLVVVGWKLLQTSRENLSQDQRLIQLQAGRSISTEINNFMNRAIDQLDKIENVLRLENSQTIRSLLEQAGVAARLQQIVETGADEGLLMAAAYDDSDFGKEAGYSFSDPELAKLKQEAYRQTLQSGQLLISAPIRLREQNRMVVLVCKPIPGAQKPLGVMQELVDLEPLRQMISENGGRNEVVLLDSRHSVFLRSNSGVPLSPEIYKEIVQDLESQKIQATFNKFFKNSKTGEEFVATVVPVRNLGWHAIVQATEQDIFGPVRAVRNEIIILIGVFIVFAGVLSALFARRISEPINQLADTTRSISQGNFSERVNVRTNNEIGEFAENFNVMAEKIEDYVTKLQHAAEENRQLFLEAIQTLAAAIDEKDPYTKGHSERVTHYSLILGRVMGLGEEALEKMRLAALLHDVGKIGIDDRILKKPDVLTPEEFDTMKQHPEKGAYIVGKIGKLRDIIPGVRHHHEQIDGKGYPLGLSGDQIPLMARIISVADTFDAMTTLRPYQKPMSTEFVLQRIRSMAGIKFDPQVVAALEQSVADGKIKRFKGQVAKEPDVVSG